MVNLGTFTLILAAFEIRHQLFIRKFVPFVRPSNHMTREEFERSVFTEGKNYVLLDDLVLDVTDFKEKHPGGRFVVEHNIGRDISKFFYGGYSLEGNMGARPQSGHIHSSYARQIVNDLAVAVYDGNSDKMEPVQTKVMKHGPVDVEY